MTLAQLQAAFAKYLLHESIELDDLGISGPFSNKELMQLYRNNFYISISEYLKACFPTVMKLVGTEFFEQLAKAFIIEKPLQQASIELYGSDFPEYIKHCKQAESVPYLADIALLDWSYDRSKTVFDFALFPFEKLTSLTDEEQMNISFSLVANTVLIKSKYPAFSIWNGVQTGELEGIDLQHGEYIIVHPEQNQGAKCYLLTQQQYDVLAAIGQGKALHELASLENFQQELGLFIEKTVINNFILEGES
ncbi:DNA-binding domain-containing protein [Gammaproteobacteria bacterium AS21]|jgi:hypothetical protein